jgi:hypothetical protein
MATALDDTKDQSDELAQMLADSVGCQGTCIYFYDGSKLVLKSGSCGGGRCPKCPATYSSSTYKLLKKLPTFFENPDLPSVPCGLISPSVPFLKLFDDYVGLQARVADLAKKSNLYRNLSILLGGVSFLLLLGLLYTRFIR